MEKAKKRSANSRFGRRRKWPPAQLRRNGLRLRAAAVSINQPETPAKAQNEALYLSLFGGSGGFGEPSGGLGASFGAGAGGFGGSAGRGLPL